MPQQQAQRRQEGGGTEVQGFPKGFKLLQLNEFQGLNRKDPRAGIGEQETAWQENLIKFGNSIRAIPDLNPALFTAPGGKTIVFFFPFNVGNVSYHAVFYSDGTADQVNIATQAVTTISSTAGTFWNSNVNLPACAQWGSSGIVIVGSTAPGASNYWAWDGTTLFIPGAFAPSWLSGTSNIAYTGTLTNGSPTVTGITPGTAGLVAGMGVTGTGIPANTTIKSVDSATQITLTFNATANGAQSLTSQWFMPFGANGIAVEIFQARVWISNGTAISFSAPSNGALFATSAGGGSFISTDPFVRVFYLALKQANGYLYLFGDSSSNVISNVQTSGSPATTTFNNSNADPQVGVPYVNTVVPYGKALLSMNGTGVYGLFGSTAEKLSEKMDNVFATAPLTLPAPGNSAGQPSAAVATIFSLKCYFVLIPIIDPFTGAQRNAMIGWDGKTWFIASQSKSLTFIATQEIFSLPVAWGTDGISIYKLFQVQSANITKKLQTKLWAGSGFIIYKQALRFYDLIQDNSGQGYNLTVAVDTDTISGQINLSGVGAFTWVNNSGGVFTWVNNSSGAFTWGTATGAVVGRNIDSVTGLLLGMTVTSTSPDFSIITLALGYIDYAPLY